MGRFEVDSRGEIILIGLNPPPQADAPVVARVEPGKSEFRMRGGKIVALGSGKGEELLRHFRTDRMHTNIFAIGIALPVAEESRQRIRAAVDKFGAKYVLSH